MEFGGVAWCFYAFDSYPEIEVDNLLHVSVRYKQTLRIDGLAFIILWHGTPPRPVITGRGSSGVRQTDSIAITRFNLYGAVASYVSRPDTLISRRHKGIVVGSTSSPTPRQKHYIVHLPFDWVLYGHHQEGSCCAVLWANRIRNGV